MTGSQRPGPETPTPSLVNATYLEDAYQRYRDDPMSVDPRWRAWFDALDAGRDGGNGATPATTPATGADAGVHVGNGNAAALAKQASVLRLINAYRVRGHQNARIDPLDLLERDPAPDLDPAYHHLDEADLDVVFNTGSLAAAERMTLRDIVDLVGRVYTGTIGSEYMHITDTPEKRWIQARLERTGADPTFPPEKRHRILERLTAAEGIEKYLHRKYVGQKRFSLEGGETLIPLMHELITRAGTEGAKEIVIGMAHRGRLNVQVNILGKEPHELFGEFEGRFESANPDTETGDVKYHQGYSSDVETPGGPVHLALAFNPSHLEIINPVVEGSVRARQFRREDNARNEVIPVLVHGDAAFAAQGVVMETLQMSQTRGFATGGTVHIIVNNQVGFTTSDPRDARSTMYCTDVAKVVQAPIFHVNADDPDAVVFVTQIALDYRMQFHKDVVIDLVCYRRHGHNEADEPAATQSVMYRKIRSMPSVRTIYAERLIQQGVVTQDEADQLVDHYREALDEGRVVADGIIITRTKNPYVVDWSPYKNVEWTHPADTAVSIDTLQSLHDQLMQVPEDFELHSRVQRILDERKRMMAGEIPCDWGFAETLAYATLLREGYPVRLCGQDSGRGTFFHRHAELHNQNDRRAHIPLQHLGGKSASFEIINSLLSEEAVLAFEYGFSTTEPRALVIWEAQFGDFVNGAQVVIDQFISSGEAKWGRLSGLTLFLPHGYEGQGPEHSSARLERFLQLCAEHNMQVCVPTTPAQMFHLLRRQTLRPYRRPLIVLTPKSLLRHKLSTSTLEDLAQQRFHPVFQELDTLDADRVKRVVVCSGKVYFELLEERRKRELDNVAIIRAEQLHPFPRDLLNEEFSRYHNAAEVVWCQEEPKNQGAWYQIQHHLLKSLLPHQSLVYAGREASPAPAVGHYQVHLHVQKKLVNEALTLRADDSAARTTDRKVG